MIAVNSITAGLYTLFSQDPVLTGSGFHVQNGAPLNSDPEYTPWIGIVRGRLQLQPHLLGSQTPWRGSLEVHVFHQEYSLLPDPDVMQRVGASADYLTTLVGSNLTLGGAVRMLQEIRTELFAFDRTAEANFVTHLITLRYDVAG